jgi:hypothetical protein
LKRIIRVGFIIGYHNESDENENEITAKFESGLLVYVAAGMHAYVNPRCHEWGTLTAT